MAEETITGWCNIVAGDEKADESKPVVDVQFKGPCADGTKATEVLFRHIDSERRMIILGWKSIELLGCLTSKPQVGDSADMLGNVASINNVPR